MGAFDKETTVTDLQIIDFLEKDYAIRQAKFSGWYAAEGNMESFLEGYHLWKRSFRGFYSEDYLERSGFEPVSPVIRTEFNSTLLTHIKLTNPDIIAINTASFRVPRALDVAREWIQQSGLTYSNYTGILVIDNKTYSSLSATWYETDTSVVQITFSGGVITGTTDQAPDLVYYQNNSWVGTECLVASVEFGSSPSPQWYVYIENQATVPPGSYDNEAILMTAIIPVKEDNEFSMDDLYMKRFLNKLGLGGGTLVDSLTTNEDGSDSSIDNAYIIEGLPFTEVVSLDPDADPPTTEEVAISNQAVVATLFKSFEYLDSGAGSSLEFKMQELDMSYSFNLSITTINSDLNAGTDLKGRPIYATAEVTSQTEESPAGGDDENLIPSAPQNTSFLTIKYQTVPGEYREMVVNNYVQEYSISGHDFTVYIDDGPELARLLIPLEILNDLKFNDFVPVHEYSFSMIVYAIETTTVKWYERLVGVVIGIVLAVIFGPAATSIYQIIIDAIVSMVISIVVGLVLSAIDNPWVTAIVGVIMVLYGGMNGTFDFSKLTVENYLPLANSVIDGASTIYGDMVQEEMEAVAEQAKEQAKADKALLDTLDTGIDVTRVLMDAHYSHSEANSAEVIISNLLGENTFNMDQYFNVDHEIGSRKTVIAG